MAGGRANFRLVGGSHARLFGGIMRRRFTVLGALLAVVPLWLPSHAVAELSVQLSPEEILPFPLMSRLVSTTPFPFQWALDLKPFW